ncbi:MAG: hypothetical protein L0220_21485, partial [Acidobacteria bacterium]|nr:hypothetical protein [Acidobacteriota bacterium]
CVPLLITIVIIFAALPSKTYAQLPSIQWTEVATLDFDINEIFTNGPILYAGTEGGGVYRTNDGWRTRALSNAGLPSGMKVRAFETIGLSLFIGSNRGVFRSNDQGQSWTEVNNGLTYNSGTATLPRSILALTTVGMTLFAGAAAAESVPGIGVSIFRSDDLGQNWTEVKNGLPATNSCSGFAYGIAGLYAATDAGVYRSTDKGENWTSANFQAAISLAMIGQNIYAMREEGIWRSDDQGFNWFRIFVAAEGQPGGAMVKLIANGTNLFALDEFVYDDTSRFPRISLSPDKGDNWYDTEIPNFEISPVVVTAFNISGDKLFACREDRKLFVRPGFYSPGIATFSTASYFDRAYASESLAVAFGANLSTGIASADKLPLPTVLAGAAIKVKDSMGVERDAPLLYVSPGQVNFQIPADTANGGATVTITLNGAIVGSGQILMQPVGPGLYTANANGYGVPAALLLRIKGDGSMQYETAFEFDSNKKEFVPKRIDLGPETDQVYLVLFGTGI